MTYGETWIGAATNAEWANFCPYAQLRAFTASLPNSDFSNRPSRVEVRTRLNLIIGTNVVSQTTRFPEGLFVQLESGVIGECLSQLNRCLIYTDHEEVTEGRRKYDDVKLQYYSTVSRLNAILAQPLSPAAPTYGIFNRNTFERFFALTWDDKTTTAPRRAAGGHLPGSDDEGVSVHSGHSHDQPGGYEPPIARSPSP